MALLYSFLYLAVLGILAHVIGEAIPHRAFHSDRFPFRAWRWEREGRIYECLRIRAWKDRLPDMSRVIPHMIPKRLGRTPTLYRVRRLIPETCRAEAVHWALCLLSPALFFFWRNGLGILLSTLPILGNLPFILIQRYNRPALIALAARLEAREEARKHRENSDSVS